MKKYIFTDNDGTVWERIDKKSAQKAYDDGATVLFCPVNMCPFTPWHLEVEVNKNHKIYIGRTFDEVVAAFEYYNCMNDETGRYTAFYIMR